jgi:hypothetical protein
MDELIAFWTARLDEEEAAAKAAAAADKYGGRANWSARFGAIVTDEEDPDWAVIDLSPVLFDDAAGVHIALHDPARVLREVAAKREILAAYIKIEADGFRDNGWIVLRFAVETLAAVDSDHADYRSEWAP